MLGFVYSGRHIRVGDVRIRYVGIVALTFVTLGLVNGIGKFGFVISVVMFGLVTLGLVIFRFVTLGSVTRD